jgi:hypothetical protein
MTGWKGWLGTFIALGFLLALLAMASVALAHSMDMNVTAVEVGHDPKVEPELFYLFNSTTRAYTDILQFASTSGNVWVKMRVANGTVLYDFKDKDWMKLYLNGTFILQSSFNLSINGDYGDLVKFSLDKWSLTDLGEFLEVTQEYKTKGESVKAIWRFSFELGATPKVTWQVTDLDKKASEKRTFLWYQTINQTFTKLSSSSLKDTTVDKVKYKDLTIDWSDFGMVSVKVATNATTNSQLVAFYPAGMTGDWEIDPSIVFAVTAVSAKSFLNFGVVNTNNPTNPMEIVPWDVVSWYFINTAAPTVEVPIGCNPFPTPAGLTAQLKWYDQYGRSWTSPPFSTGTPTQYVLINVEIPICWVSVRTSDGINDQGAFHAWNITPDPPGIPTAFIDEPIGFPIVVDDTTPVDWIVGLPADRWIYDSGTLTLPHNNLLNHREYLVTFNVTTRTQPTTVWLRLYDASTGEGIPWERFITSWNGTLLYSDVVQTWTGQNYTVIVTDFFGNELYNQSLNVTEAPLHLWKVPIVVWSVKFFNQDPDYVHKIGVYWNHAGIPKSFYIAPIEVVELYLHPGDYRIRWTPYHNYVAQATQQFDITVSDAAYFLINGTTISHIVTDVEGVYALQQVITDWVTPDTVWLLETSPRCPESLEPEAATRLIHPYSITRATVNYTIPNHSHGLLWCPYPNRPGRTYEVLSDVLTITGAYATTIKVNRTTGGNVWNTAYNPGSIVLGDGANYTVWASSAVTWTRTVTWREFDLFYWLYTVVQGKYEVTLWQNNTQNMTWRDVRWFVAWPEDSTIDLAGVTVYDVDNGLFLERGENFDVSAGGVAMAWASLNTTQLRTFMFTAWDANASETLSPPTISCADPTSENYDDELYYMAHGQWTNDYALPYHGLAFLSVEVDGSLNPDSVRIFDVRSDQELDSTFYSVAGTTIIINSEAVGTVPVGGSLEYRVYFKAPVADQGLSFFSPLVVIGGVGISLYWVSAAFAVGATVAARKRLRKADGTMALLTVIAIFAIIGMLHNQGVFN